MGNDVYLITYVDRLAGDLSGLDAVLSSSFKGVFSGVHLLPFFDPIDGADAGFDPSDHLSVDARLGTWSDVSRIGDHTAVMADLIVNHVSRASPQFQDVIEHGSDSVFWPLFLRKNDVFPDSASNEDLKAIYRPRPGAPFTEIRLRDGTPHAFWTTFSSEQLDINVECVQGRKYLREILTLFAQSGVTFIRLDAAGYAVKRPGSSCFMLPETYAFIGDLSEQAKDLGMETLVEIHTHYQTQITIADKVGWVYDFALPPLVLHTLYTQDTIALKEWIAISPRNCVTVLDTHDGIGIVDVRGTSELPGLLSDAQIESLLAEIERRTSGESARASGHSAQNLDVYQINTTYYDALGKDDRLYLIARAIQLFLPGIPQIYYMGLLAEPNDLELLEETSVGRDINRHFFTAGSVQGALERPVVKSLFRLIQIRRNTKAFAYGGRFICRSTDPQKLVLHWKNQANVAQLDVDLTRMVATIRVDSPEEGTAVFHVADRLEEVGDE